MMQTSSSDPFKQALAKFRSGDVKGGLIDLDQAIQLDPSRWEYFWTRGAFHFRRRAYAEAEADLTKAIELCTDEKQAAKIYRRRMYCYGRREAYEAVIADATWVIDRGFADVNVYEWRAWARYWLGRPIEEAIADYSQIIASKPDDFSNRINRITMYYRSKRYAEALQDLNDALSLALRNLSVSKAPAHIIFMYRALVFYQQGDFESSLNEYNLSQIMMAQETYQTVEAYLSRIKSNAESFYIGMPSRPNDFDTLKWRHTRYE